MDVHQCIIWDIVFEGTLPPIQSFVAKNRKLAHLKIKQWTWSRRCTNKNTLIFSVKISNFLSYFIVNKIWSLFQNTNVPRSSCYAVCTQSAQVWVPTGSEVLVLPYKCPVISVISVTNPSWDLLPWLPNADVMSSEMNTAVEHLAKTSWNFTVQKIRGEHCEEVWWMFHHCSRQKDSSNSLSWPRFSLNQWYWGWLRFSWKNYKLLHGPKRLREVSFRRVFLVEGTSVFGSWIG